ncbi:MAG: dipicolinate synthase [Oscillospiraceae bacterium]|nr:dipicolinate synthase [Oscillospiraceae bacterium]
MRNFPLISGSPIANAVPTAEGALQLAMASTDYTLSGSRCLVTGYGRIGRLLSERLQALGANVTIAARKYSDFAWAAAHGFSTVQISRLSGRLGAYDLIFNTVPALLFDANRLRETREDCVLLDLASAPGGFDQTAAKALGRQVICAPGLPGKTAPRTAAAAIRDSIYHILEERGEPI